MKPQWSLRKSALWGLAAFSALSVEPLNETGVEKLAKNREGTFSALSVEPLNETQLRSGSVGNGNQTFSALSVEPLNETMRSYHGKLIYIDFQCSLC